MKEDLKELWYKAYDLAPNAIRPCVCSDTIPKSPKSSITSPYKIPTLINAQGEYAGIRAWQNLKDIVGINLEKYATNPVYGILLLCKDFLVIDVDVEDIETVEKIHKLLPPTCYRQRTNSARRAYIYKKDYALKKNLLAIPQGMIEFLGDVQVCQIAGRHRSGAQLYWTPEFPSKQNVPYLSKNEFTWLYESLSIKLLGSKNPPIVSNPFSKKGCFVDSKDKETRAVMDSNLFIETDVDGKIFVKCPLESVHTTPTNKTDACYFPKGYDGKEKSGFHCFHTSHGKITLEDFLQAIDYHDNRVAGDASDFVMLKKQINAIKDQNLLTEQEKKSKIIKLLLPFLDVRFNKHRKRTELLRTLDNYELLFEFFPPNLYYDRFTSRVYYNNDPSSEAYDISLECDYSKKFSFASSSNRTGIKTAIKQYLKTHQKDSLQAYFKNLKWDGVQRLKTFHTDCLRLSRDDFAAKAYMYYLFTAAAARGLGTKPIQADMIVTLCGAQGIGKTTFVRLLNPKLDWYRSINVFISKEEKIRSVQGFFITEFAEISHLNDRIEVEVKDFVTQTTNTWRPLYSDVPVTRNRRFILIGTSNHTHFLNDTTGNRRWLPLHLKKEINTDYIKQHRDQLFAEAKYLYERKGVYYEKAAIYAAQEEYKYLIRDRWTHHVAKHLAAKDYPQTVQVEYLLENIIGVRPSDLDSSKHISRMHRVLKSLQYKRSLEDEDTFIKVDDEL